MNEMVKIKDFAEVITGGTPSTKVKEYWEKGTIPWLNSGELNEDIVVKSDNYITNLGLEKSAARLMPKDTILIALTGATTGVVGYLNIEACANQSVTGILPSKRHHPKYLYYYLKSIRNKVLSDSYGGAQKHISQGYIKGLEIPLFPLHIQIRIADILDKAYGVSKKDQQLFLKYTELLQSIFYDMFGDPIKNEKKWEKISLGELCNDFKYGTNQKSFDAPEKGAMPIIRIPNVLNNSVNYNDLKYSNLSGKEYNEVRLEKGDLLFVRTNGNPAYIGRCAVFNDTIEAGYASYLIRARLKNKIIVLPEFLQTTISFPSYRALVLKRATTTAGNYNINTVALKSLPIYLPPIELQEEFLVISQNIQQQKQRVSYQIRNSENLYQGLLQKAFNGELLN
jgi:type I restriction enzyme S subunit